MVAYEIPDAIRQSLIATWDTCPLRTLFALQDERRTPGALAARGTLLHRAIHKAYRKLAKSGERQVPIEVGMEILLDVLCQMGPETASEDFVPLSMREMKWCRVGMTNWCEWTDVDASRMLAAEERLTAPLELRNGRTVDVTGQMDLILSDYPRGLVIIDEKTGYRRPKQTRNTPNSESEGTGLTELGWVQWLVYSFLAFEKWPAGVVDYVDFRERHVMWKEERHARMWRQQMERLRDPLIAQVTALDEAMREGPESKRWVPSAGTHCVMCSRPSACPIMELEGLDLETEEGRRQVAHGWVVSSERRDRYRTVLDGIVDVYGPIEVPHAYGRRAVGWDVDPAGKRRFGLFEPRDVPESPYDDELVSAARDAGVLDG